MKKLAVIDIDDTICALASELISVCNLITKKSLTYKDWTSYDVYKSYNIKPELYFELCESEKVLQKAHPISGARDALYSLIEQDYLIIYLTARGWHKNAQAITDAWLKKWDFPDAELNVIPLDVSKAQFILRCIGEIDIVADDNPHHVREFVRYGCAANTFLIDQPWNKIYRDLDPYRITSMAQVPYKL